MSETAIAIVLFVVQFLGLCAFAEYLVEHAGPSRRVVTAADAKRQVDRILGEAEGMAVPDPLREEFAKLERDVKEREWREFQVACPHRRTYELRQIGRVPLVTCQRCGFTTQAEP